MKVCIDAGHGGKDGGAQGATVSEKWIALDVANRVAQKLQNSGMSVVMTRDSDYFVELAERANIANQTGADVFVSIHCNSGPSTAQGTEVWSYPGEAEDKRLAEKLLERIIARTGLHSRGTKEENFAVLRLTRCPAALVELGFISNVQEEQLMKTFDYQDQASTAIVEGIKQYMGNCGGARRAGIRTGKRHCVGIGKPRDYHGQGVMAGQTAKRRGRILAGT